MCERFLQLRFFPVRTGDFQPPPGRKPAVCGPPTAHPPGAADSMPRYPAGAGGTSGKGPFWPLPGVLCAPAVRRRRGELGAGPRGRAGPGRPPTGRYAWVGWDARVRSWGAAVQTASSLYLYIVNAHMQGPTAGQPLYERWGRGGIFGSRGSQLVGKSPWLGSAAHFS